MRNIFILTLVILLSAVLQSNTATINQNVAWTGGEKLTYRVHYGLINAGKVTMETSGPIQIGDKSTWKLKVEGETLKSFDWAYKIRDKFESWSDCTLGLPVRYAKSVRENTYFDEDVAIFNHQGLWLRNTKGKLTIPADCQDLPGAIYKLRQIDFTTAKIGQTWKFNVYLDNKVWPLSLKFVGKESLKTDLGTIKCLKMKPQLIVDRVFKKSDDMTVWVSDDKNKIPIRVQTNIWVGSVKVDITSATGLNNAFTSKSND